MRIQPMVTGALAALFSAVLLAGCGGAPPAASSAAPPPAVSSAAEAEGWPEVDTVTLDGAAVTRADFTGNTLTVLNVWATWCPPCVAELPHLEAMNRLFAEQGVEVVGVLQDGVDAQGAPDEAIIQNAKALLQDAGAAYRVILPDAVLTETFISGMQYFPTTFFLDAEGNLLETVIGANDEEDWEGIIRGVLEKIA